MRFNRLGALALAAATLGACSLDLTNPNAPTPNNTQTTDGVVALATGLQGRYASTIGNFGYTGGLVTDEFAAVSAALISISDAEQGAVPPGTGIADAVFNSIYRTVRSADDVLTALAPLTAQFDPGTVSGIRALAWTVKADALGMAIMTYQTVPINTFGVTAPTYVNRAAALAYIRALLDSAATGIGATAPSTFFNASILTPGVNLPNVVQLLRARYARMAGDDATAIAASNLVGRSGASALSVLTFPAPNVNPFANATGGANGIAPRRSWRLSMVAGDGRAGYFVIASASLLGRVGTPIDAWNVYASATASLPVYFPDEALLIKAEALYNQGTLAPAQAVLDSVRTDCPGGRGMADPKACLAALGGPLTAPQLVDEIYNQRRYELYGTGLRWEDARRRGYNRGPAPSPATPLDAQRCWLPYSLGDRNANPNATFAALPDPTEPTVFPAVCPTP